ncbi:MAG: hypothetical protein WBG92_09935 [Thiohalocapsa sp.]
MIQERMIVDALLKSGIQRVVLIDDAFDAPHVPSDKMGDFLEAFSKVSNTNGIAPNIDRSLLAPAISAIEDSEYDSKEVLSAIDALYREYIKALDSQLDPGGFFSAEKNSALRYLLPLKSLLEKCGSSLQIVLRGSLEDDEDEIARDAELFFVDYYLGADLSPDGEPSHEQHRTYRQAALDRLRQLIEGAREPSAEIPAILLMSSHPIADIDDFRTEITTGRGNVFASRFGFVQKKEISQEKDEITIDGGTLDSMLTVLESFAFGKALYSALWQWKEGMDNAVEEVWTKIGALSTRDFAYIGRFRLAPEGMKLSDYLEWLFGESVIDAMGAKVEWNHEAFGAIDQVDGAIKGISGAFDGASKALAEMYDRARVIKPRPGDEQIRRMGDLFLEDRGNGVNGVLAILTPNCDLVMRNGKRAAKRVLAVRGELVDLAAQGASLQDFLIVEGRGPMGILWKAKDIQTFEHEDLDKAADGDSDHMKFAGTLRPSYASELQSRIFADASRIGVNVPPPLWTSAKATAKVKRTKSRPIIEFDMTSGTNCSVVHSRGGKDKVRVIFSRSAAVNFIDWLKKIAKTDLATTELQDILEKLKNGEQEQDKVIQTLCHGGMEFGVPLCGIEVSERARWPRGDNQAWCKIEVKTEKAVQKE